MEGPVEWSGVEWTLVNHMTRSCDLDKSMDPGSGAFPHCPSLGRPSTWLIFGINLGLRR